MSATATARGEGTAATHIAVFGEMTIFSLSGNSFHTCGSSTGLRSAGET